MLHQPNAIGQKLHGSKLHGSRLPTERFLSRIFFRRHITRSCCFPENGTRVNLLPIQERFAHPAKMPRGVKRWEVEMVETHNSQKEKPAKQFANHHFQKEKPAFKKSRMTSGLTEGLTSVSCLNGNCVLWSGNQRRSKWSSRRSRGLVSI